jgi:hypothetical protein
LPLYLEWAPDNTFKQGKEPKEEEPEVKIEGAEQKTETIPNAEALEKSDEDEGDSPQPNATKVFFKNLNFETTEEVGEHFKRLCAIHVVQIAKKLNP